MMKIVNESSEVDFAIDYFCSLPLPLPFYPASGWTRWDTRRTRRALSQVQQVVQSLE